MTQQAKYRLEIVSPDEPPAQYDLGQPIVQIGRDAAHSDLVLAHSWVSRVHARIYCDREPYRIQDMGSSNGTQVNDLPLAPDEMRPLGVGDVIAIGPFRLTLVLTGLVPEAPEEAPSPPVEEQPGEEIDLSLLERIGARRAPGAAAAPPATPPPQPPTTELGEVPVAPWVGMPRRASRWLQYLPPIYADNDFFGRYLLVFEDLLGPIQQIIAHFDLFLDPATTPASFIPYLNDWMGHLVDEHWSGETQRELLRQASWLHQARGTRAGLTRYLEIATGAAVEIEENVDGPHTFRVTLRQGERAIDRRIVERIIELNRPAHTSFRLEIV
jgi:phage tail-like protein